MRISARKGSKITLNVFELKLTKPRKIILNLVTTDTEHFNSNLFVFLSSDRFRSLHGVLPLIWNEAFATKAPTWSDLGKHLGETMLAQPIVARP